MMKSVILIVDDERLLAETIAINLQKAGFETIAAYDGESALAMARDHKPDLIVLDVMLPKVSGWEVCRALRTDSQYLTGVPVLMLTARGEESDKVIGLELGADDYLVKPFSMRELVARVRALLRRTAVVAAQPNETLQCGPVTMDIARHEVRVGTNGDAREVKLSLKEFELLKALLSQSGRAVPRETLLERVWGDDFFGDERTLDVHIRWLREKLESVPSQPAHILTVRGVGYKFKS
ncbi:MAG TPA: response regulator transcription factor [Abditibacteriaceae bacterium]|jgi:DNA-binding response OmpR family regulator